MNQNTQTQPVNRLYKSKIFAMLYSSKKELLELYEHQSTYSVKEEHPALELTAVMLNINRGHNEKLKGMCKSLKDYSEYTERVRKYAREIPVEEAVERAIQECIEEDILAEFLKQNRAEAKSVSIYEYDQEKHMRQERETFWEESRVEGRGELLKEQIQKKLAKGKSISVIAEEVEEEEAVIEKLVQDMK